MMVIVMKGDDEGDDEGDEGDGDGDDSDSRNDDDAGKMSRFVVANA